MKKLALLVAVLIVGLVATDSYAIFGLGQRRGPIGRLVQRVRDRRAIRRAARVQNVCNVQRVRNVQRVQRVKVQRVVNHRLRNQVFVDPFRQTVVQRFVVPQRQLRIVEVPRFNRDFVLVRNQFGRVVAIRNVNSLRARNFRFRSNLGLTNRGVSVRAPGVRVNVGRSRISRVGLQRTPQFRNTLSRRAIDGRLNRARIIIGR